MKEDEGQNMSLFLFYGINSLRYIRTDVRREETASNRDFRMPGRKVDSITPESMQSQETLSGF